MAKSRMNSTKAELDCAKAEVEALKTEVEALKEIKRRIEDMKERYAKEQEKIKENCTGCITWRGDIYNGHLARADAIDLEYAHERAGIESKLDEVCDEITRRENDIYERNSQIGWLQSQWNSLCNGWEKLTN